MLGFGFPVEVVKELPVFGSRVNVVLVKKERHIFEVSEKKESEKFSLFHNYLSSSTGTYTHEHKYKMLLRDYIHKYALICHKGPLRHMPEIIFVVS